VQHASWAPLSAFAVSLLSVWWLTSERAAELALDKPNARSLHHAPTPRTGGIGVLLGFFLAWVFIQPSVPLVITAATVVLAAVSLTDDVLGLSVLLRLATHLASSVTACAYAAPLDWGIGLIFVAAIATTWMTNLYNFMDGSDGLAGGMTLFGFGFYGIAALLAGHVEFALLNFGIAAAAAGFLVFNFHPARIFMGDVGSVPLGFLAATLGLVGWQQGSWTWWFPLLVFSPFIVDASVTLARRLLRRERVWRAHRDHYYQRLVQMGWGHRNTAFAEYGLMTACGLCAVGSLFSPPGGQLALIAALAIAYVAFALAIDRAWRRFRAPDY